MTNKINLWAAGAAFAALLAPNFASAQTANLATPTDEDIVVTAARTPQTLNQLGSAISIVDAEVIERQQLQSLDEALERVPGVSITRSGGLGQNTQVRLRGFTTKHVLVMIDGIKLNNAAESSNQFGINNLLLDNVERVEVLRGPQSGVYGADAVAGVIHVITRRPEGPMQWRANAGYGSHNTAELGLSADGEAGAFSYLFGASYLSTDGISLASRAPGNVEDDGYENLTLNARVTWELTPNAEIDSWVRYTQAQNDTDNGSLPAGNPLGLPPYLFQDSPGYVDNNELFAAIRGTLETFGGALTHEVQLSYVDVESQSVTPFAVSDSLGRTIEASYVGSWNFAPESAFLFGAEHRIEDGAFDQPAGSAFAAIDESRTNSAVFVNLNLAPVEGLYLSGAARYDNNEEFGGDTTYRITGAYNLPEQLHIAGFGTKIRASYGTGAEAPSLRQLLGSSPTYQGNRDLTPESTWMAEAGLDLTSADRSTRVSLSYYTGEATDGIFNIYDPLLGVSRPENTPDVVAMEGIELELEYAPVRWLELSFAYANSSATMVATGVQLFGRPENEASVALTLMPTDAFSMTLDAYWRDNFFSDYPSSYEMPGYSVFNLSAGYQLTEGVRVSARLQNLFDEQYEEKLGDSTYGRTVHARLQWVF